MPKPTNNLTINDIKYAKQLGVIAYHTNIRDRAKAKQALEQFVAEIVEKEKVEFLPHIKSIRT